MTLKSGLLGAAIAVGLGLPALAGAMQTANARPAANHEFLPAAIASVPQDSAGKAIFAGKGVCFACHGPDAKGTPLAPDLTDAKWLHIDGSLESIVKIINDGVAAPKESPAPMPAKGGAALTDAEVQAVAKYVFSISRPKG